jgi:hypothetical protein
MQIVNNLRPTATKENAYGYAEIEEAIRAGERVTRSIKKGA